MRSAGSAQREGFRGGRGSKARRIKSAWLLTSSDKPVSSGRSGNSCSIAWAWVPGSRLGGRFRRWSQARRCAIVASQARKLSAATGRRNRLRLPNTARKTSCDIGCVMFLKTSPNPAIHNWPFTALTAKSSRLRILSYRPMEQAGRSARTGVLLKVVHEKRTAVLAVPGRKGHEQETRSGARGKDASASVIGGM